MALPKAAANLGQEAKKIAEQVARPIQSRVDNVRETVATQEGLKNIAFNATSRDPVIGITTGIALGIGALGVGLGAKGLSSAFKGVRRLFGSLPEPDEDVETDFEVEDRRDDMGESFDSIESILMNHRNDFTEYKDDVLNHLNRILAINEELVNINEGMLTNAARERLKQFRVDAELLENSKEQSRYRERFLDAIEDLKPSNDVFANDGDGKGDGIFGKVLGANLLANIATKVGGIITGTVAAIFGKGFIKKMVGSIFNIVKAVPRLAIGFLSKINFAAAFFGIGLSLAEGIGDAIETWASGGSILQGIGEFFSGTVGRFLELLTGGLLDKDAVATFLTNARNTLFGVIGNLVDTTTGAISDVAPSLGKWLVESIIGKLNAFASAASDVNSFFTEKLKSWFSDMMDMIKAAALSALQNVPIIGDTIAKSYMSEEEAQALDAQREREKARKKLVEVEEGIDDVKGRKTGLLYSVGKQQEDLAELREQKLRLQSDLGISTAASGKRSLAEAVASSQELQSTGQTPVVVQSSPVTATTQNNNVTQQVTTQLSANNIDDSINRFVNNQF